MQELLELGLGEGLQVDGRHAPQAHVLGRPPGHHQGGRPAQGGRVVGAGRGVAVRRQVGDGGRGGLVGVGGRGGVQDRGGLGRGEGGLGGGVGGGGDHHGGGAGREGVHREGLRGGGVQVDDGRAEAAAGAAGVRGVAGPRGDGHRRVRARLDLVLLVRAVQRQVNDPVLFETWKQHGTINYTGQPGLSRKTATATAAARPSVRACASNNCSLNQVRVFTQEKITHAKKSRIHSPRVFRLRKTKQSCCFMPLYVRLT